MTLEEVRNLHAGDSVTWTDPAEACSHVIEISKIDIQGDDDDFDGEEHGDEVVQIWDVDGGYLECYAGELS